MKITWLGQAGFLFETEKICIMIDPYLSNSVEKRNPQSYRRVPVNEALFALKPDVMIFTHNHLDHYDPETVSRYISTTSNVVVLAPHSVLLHVSYPAGLHPRKTGSPGSALRLLRLPWVLNPFPSEDTWRTATHT